MKRFSVKVFLLVVLIHMAPRRVRAMHKRAKDLISELRLQPHPEGGYFREVFRSADKVQPLDERSARVALTTIYFCS
jgi:Cupin superfamily (DUF985)